MSWLTDFVTESNRIEGIQGATEEEVSAHALFLASGAHVADLKQLVGACAPGHVLRDRAGLDVRVGDHIAPAGGPQVLEELERLLGRARGGALSAHEAHCQYETLHPFTDGNGRSGRALWLWMMERDPKRRPTARSLLFLHSFYYQTLAALDARQTAHSKEPQ